MAADRPRTAGDAPDLYVGIGEAAEVFDLPHVRLHAAIREGRLATYAGRRDGRLVRLLRLGDLVAMVPALAERPLPELRGGDPIAPPPPPRGSAEDRRPEEEGRGASSGAVRSIGAPPPGAVPRGGRRGRGDAASRDESVRYLWGELERVRHQVRDSREHQEALVRQLVESGEETRRLFEKLSIDEASRRVAEAELGKERAEVDRALTELRRLRRFTLASVATVVVLALATIGYVARATLATSAAAERELAAGGEVPAVGEVASPSPDRAAPVSHVAEALVPAEDDAQASAVPSSTGSKPIVGLGTDLEGGPAAPPAVASEVPSEAQHAAESPAASDVLAATPLGSDVRAGSDDRAGSAATPPPPAEARAPEARAEGEAGSGVAEVAPPLRPIPGRPPAAARVGDRPCALFPVTRPGMPLRDVLGPCWGRWNPELGAIVGSSRTGEEAYCRQHAFFERALGASIARAEQEAALARRDGLVPPLLRMRVETAASAALAEHVPTWLESGFEAGSVEGHRVQPVHAGAGRWRVESWVRYVDFAGNERRRTFRLEVLLGEGPDPDQECAFVWTDEEREVDAGRDPGSRRGDADSAGAPR